MTEAFSISGAASASAAFWLKGVRAAWLAMLMTLAVSLAPLWARDWFAHTPLWQQDLLQIPLSAFLGLMVTGALYRAALAPDLAEARRLGLGVGGVQFGKPELNLLMASLLFGLGIGVAILGASLVLAVVGLIVGVDVERAIDLTTLAPTLRTTPAWKLAALAAAAVPALLAVVYLLMRAILYRAATVAEGRVALGAAFAASRGRVLALSVAFFLVSLPGLGAYFFQVWGFGLGPDLVERVKSGLPLNSGLMVFILVQALIGAFVQNPLAVGLFSYAYGTLKPAAEPAVPVT